MTVDKVDSPVLVFASTGVAAFNINGSTFHSMLSLSILSKNNFNISDKRLNQLQSKLSYMKYFIIVKKSMVRCRMLALIDMRLWQAFPKHNNKHFVYKQFIEMYKLKVIQKQSETLTTRVEDKLGKIKQKQFSDAKYILPKWFKVDKINIEKLKSLNCPITKIIVTHTGIGAKNADSNVVIGLEAQLLLAKGTQIMLTANLWTNVGLINRAPLLVLQTERKLFQLHQFGVYRKSLILPQAIVDFGNKEFAAGLSFVAVSRVYALNNLMFKPFIFERL
ncbi:3381_t:CDS:2 [Cetraspora pellucida]|uniref:ATP-dependent DNA helicase n=1 Tax=Cetraspora pellucida TaxID=1433469 RepID=A0A9N9P379_9GLOM|nr:3381_t:CDS:2 [Cetraspora pellucida]